MLFRSTRTISVSQNPSSETESTFVMDGSLQTHHNGVCAGQTSTLHIKGGFTHQRHDEIKNTFASFMDEVCHDVEIEPHLQSLQGESFDNRTTTTEDDARLDIKANGLWGSRFCKTFFDVKIFNPHARTCPRNTNEAYKHHENAKN